MPESIRVAPCEHASPAPACFAEEKGYVLDGSLLPGLHNQQPVNQYLESMPLARRRRGGQVYTPRYLAESILDRAGYTSDEPIEDRTLIDPACGAGVFLVAAIRRLGERLERGGLDLSSRRGRSFFLRSVARNVYGVDVDRRACELAREAVRDEVSRLIASPTPKRFFQSNVACSDYLLGFRISRLSRRLRSGVDFVVGNPPYVPTTRITSAYKERLRGRFRTASGRLDLYTLFIERSVGLLASRGRLAFITPNKFLVSVTSRPLRALLLSEGAVHTIVNFRSHRVFDHAATVPCIIVFERGGMASEVAVFECHDRPAPNGELAIVAHAKIDRAHFGEGPWHLTGGVPYRLAEGIRGHHATLETFTLRISAGIATGSDGIYVLPAEVAIEIEPEVRRRAVRGRDLAPYEITDPGLDVIIPYVYDSAGRPQLVNLANYPKVHSYLACHRKGLEKRHCCRVWSKAWYDVHDPVPFDLAARPKILVPDVARSNRFAYDPGRYCPLHSAYYLIPKDIDPLYLTAVLNSKPIEFLIRLLAPVVKDGFSRYRRQFLLGLPVPKVSEMQMREIAEAARTRDYMLAEELVASLFGLTRSERDGVARHLSNLGGQNGKKYRTLASR